MKKPTTTHKPTATPPRSKPAKAVSRPAVAQEAAKGSTRGVSQGERVIEALRECVRDAEGRGITRYAMAKASGVTQGQLSRMMSEDREPRLGTAARILWAAGFEMKIQRRKKTT
jgi:DNA-binding phage protein